MRLNETKFFLFVASIIIGVLISMNIKFDNTSPIILTSAEYSDFYKAKETLQEDISGLSSKFEANISKLRKYEKGGTSISTVSEEISKEKEQNDLLLGKVAVYGPGVAISLQDITTINNSSDLSKDEINRRTLHDSDFILLTGALKNAGAKAISINDVRLTYNSSIVCAGSFIMIDNSIKIPGPFKIKAIGNKDTIKNYLLNEDHYVQYLQSDLRHISVTVTSEDNITIPAYSGTVKNHYMKDAD